MVVSNVVSGASQAAIAILLFSGHAQIWQVAALTAVAGASSAFFFPASSGIVPQTVPESKLQPANAVLRLGRNGSVIVGGALAGLVIHATSPATGIAIDAASFGVAALLTAAMRIPKSRADGGLELLRRPLARLAGVHLADLALGDRAPVRRRQRRRAGRLGRARAGDLARSTSAARSAGG